MRSTLRTPRLPRRGLTLIELLVVLVILAALAAMVIPRFGNMGLQASAAAGATIIADTNTAVQAFVSRYSRAPDGWDSLLNDSGGFYSCLSSRLTAGTPAVLQVASLTATQADSLASGGITSLCDAVELRAGMPSDNSTSPRAVAAGQKVAMVVETPVSAGYGSTLIDKALNLNQNLDASGKSKFGEYDYVAVGLGGPVSIKGATMMEIPLAVTPNLDPTKNYCRVICVFKVPDSTKTTSFPAQYIGCFLPDATSQRDSVDSYHQSQAN